MGRLSVALTAIAVSAGALAPAAAQAAPPVTRTPGRFEATPSFTVTYSGAGSFRTAYHSTPPNPGGRHDTNDADDSSTQRWSLRFSRRLRVPRCRPAARRSCVWPVSLSGAAGATRATGRIDHRHVDGLFAADNRWLRCRVAFSTPRGMGLQASIALQYRRARRALSITALDPVSDAVTDPSQQCPGQGDPIDGLYGNYFMPGFSFAPGYGPDRWFRSATATVPLRVLRRSSRLRIRLHRTRAGPPPRGCRVSHPAYEHCAASGGWSGVLVLRRR